MSRFNWRALMRAGLREAGLRPAEFWALTPAELMLICGRDRQAAPLSRSRLDELAAAFPDERGPIEDGGI